MSKDKSGSPPCGIYVRVDDYSDMPKTITALRQMAMVINRASGYEKNFDVVELVYNKGHAEQINDLMMIMKAQGMIAVVSGVKAEHAQNFPEADGFLSDDLDTFQAMKASLKEESIFGLRGNGEDMLSAGADFVVVKADPAFLMKANAKENAPLLCASGKGITNDNVASLALAGASFVEATDYIFSHEKGVMQGAVNILHALDLAAQAQQVTQN